MQHVGMLKVAETCFRMAKKQFLFEHSSRPRDPN